MAKDWWALKLGRKWEEHGVYSTFRPAVFGVVTTTFFSDSGPFLGSRVRRLSSDMAVVVNPPPAKIDHFRGDYAFLSNFTYSPIHRDGLEYPTVEHAFQAAKCLDMAGKQSILADSSPSAAKRLGRRVQLRPDWESVKVDIMLDILRLKFAPATDFAVQLVATGEAQLIEGNTWHDNYWGSCMCAKHRSRPGANVLGKLLTQVRKELMD